ncbi:ribosome maturation factor RimP [Candidatus Poriferisodalis sp.]|uniref:ribosome maturation factor RimP n=1 Tax=Candidatus Poriferisodalis sp. TaxID=3101277 RepID=UPI003C6F41F8
MIRCKRRFRRHSPEGGWGYADREVAMTHTAAASRAPASAHPSEIADLAGPVATEVGCALYDVQWRGGTLVVLASAMAGGAIGVEALGRLSRRLSAALDAADVIEGRYVLEVSSPGLERSLNRLEHFAGAVGEQVVIRTSESPRRRIVGEILESDPSGVSVRVEEISSGEQGHAQAGPDEIGQILTVPFDDIAKARTTFEWGPRPRRKPGSRSTPHSKSDPRSKPGRQRR